MTLLFKYSHTSIFWI